MSHCQICLENESRYTCPKCSIKTCSLDCVKRHKVQADCDGVIDNTEYVKKDEFVKNEVLVQRDYNFLMGLDRTINVAKGEIRTKNKRILGQNSGPNKRRQNNGTNNQNNQDNGTLIVRRGVNVKCVPRGMERSLINKSSWDKRRNTFVWTVEFLLVDHENGALKDKYVSYRVPEDKLVKEILPDKIKELINEGEELGEWYVFLKKIGTKADDLQYIPLDKETFLADALRDETVIEFPTLIVSKGKNVLGYKEYEDDESSDSDTDSSDDSDEDSSDSDSDESENESEDEEPQEESSKQESTSIVTEGSIINTEINESISNIESK